MGIGKSPQQRKTAVAFTLVELLLTIVLILLLAGAMIYNFGVLHRGARLEEGSIQVETLFRFARAEASSRGREVRVLFGAEAIAALGLASGSSNSLPSTAASTNSNSSGAAPDGSQSPEVRVVWEPDPLGAPGKFIDLPGASSLAEQIGDLVRVRDVRPFIFGASETSSLPGSFAAFPLDSGGTNALPSGGSNVPAALSPVVFYPDGSSDSVEIVLAPLDDEDSRQTIVSLSGLTGMLRHRTVILTPEGIEPPDTNTDTRSPVASSTTSP